VRKLLALVLLFAACRHGETTAGLGVDLFLDQDTVAIHGTLSGTIRLRNMRPDWMTVEFPNAQQAEVLFYDEQGRFAFGWPGYRQPAESELSLGPWCGRDYQFQFSPWDLAGGTLRAGSYRAHARPADYPSPWTEKSVVLTGER
jgi:hypothetical protein